MVTLHRTREVSTELLSYTDMNFTLVFFMRHLSHAFHTLLCLPSNTTELCSCDEPDLFELLLRDLEGFDIFLDRCDLLSSNGGEGKPELDMSLKGIEKSVVGWGG